MEGCSYSAGRGLCGNAAETGSDNNGVIGTDVSLSHKVERGTVRSCAPVPGISLQGETYNIDCDIRKP